MLSNATHVRAWIFAVLTSLCYSRSHGGSTKSPKSPKSTKKSSSLRGSSSSSAAPTTFAQNGGYSGLWEGINPINGAIETVSIFPLRGNSPDRTLFVIFRTDESDQCPTGGRSIVTGSGVPDENNVLQVQDFALYCGGTTNDPPIASGIAGIVVTDEENDLILAPSGPVFDPRRDNAYRRISATV